MSPVLRDYGVAYFPMGKALKLHPGLEELATTVKAGSKSEAARIGDSMLLAHAPEHVPHYFQAKVWEDRPGLPRSAFDRFITDFFQTVAVWNKKKGEPDPKVIEPSIEDEGEEVGRLLAAQRGEFVQGISDPEDPKWEKTLSDLRAGKEVSFSAPLAGKKEEVNSLQDDVRPPMCNREIEIAYALNDLVSGRTDIIDQDDAGTLISSTGHLLSGIIPLLMTDIIMTEACLSPSFDDVEIQDVATTILESWDDNYHVRLRVAMDAIVEYRRPSTQPVAPIPPSSSLLSPRFYEEPSVSEEFRQQLLCSVLQGLCANPVHSKSSEGIAVIAIEIVDDVIRQQEEAHE